MYFRYCGIFDTIMESQGPLKIILKMYTVECSGVLIIHVVSIS